MAGDEEEDVAGNVECDVAGDVKVSSWNREPLQAQRHGLSATDALRD